MLGALDVHSFLAIVLHSIHSVLHSAEAIGCHFGVGINALHPTTQEEVALLSLEVGKGALFTKEVNLGKLNSVACVELFVEYK